MTLYLVAIQNDDFFYLNTKKVFLINSMLSLPNKTFILILQNYQICNIYSYTLRYANSLKLYFFWF